MPGRHCVDVEGDGDEHIGADPGAVQFGGDVQHAHGTFVGRSSNNRSTAGTVAMHDANYAMAPRSRRRRPPGRGHAVFVRHPYTNDMGRTPGLDIMVVGGDITALGPSKVAWDFVSTASNRFRRVSN